MGANSARNFSSHAAEPQHAGSPGSKAVADYARALFADFGLDVQIDFEAMLP